MSLVKPMKYMFVCYVSIEMRRSLYTRLIHTVWLTRRSFFSLLLLEKKSDFFSFLLLLLFRLANRLNEYYYKPPAKSWYCDRPGWMQDKAKICMRSVTYLCIVYLALGETHYPKMEQKWPHFLLVWPTGKCEKLRITYHKADKNLCMYFSICNKSTNNVGSVSV